MARGARSRRAATLLRNVVRPDSRQPPRLAGRPREPQRARSSRRLLESLVTLVMVGRPEVLALCGSGRILPRGARGRCVRGQPSVIGPQHLRNLTPTQAVTWWSQNPGV